MLENIKIKKLKMKKIIEKEKEYQENGNLDEFIYFLYENKYITFLLNRDSYRAVEEKVNRMFKKELEDIAYEVKVAKATLLRNCGIYTEQDEEYTESFMMPRIIKFLTKEKFPNAEQGDLLLVNGYVYNEFFLEDSSFYKKHIINDVFINNYLLRYVDSETWKAAIKYNKKGDKLFLDSAVLF